MSLVYDMIEEDADVVDMLRNHIIGPVAIFSEVDSHQNAAAFDSSSRKQINLKADGLYNYKHCGPLKRQ